MDSVRNAFVGDEKASVRENFIEETSRAGLLFAVAEPLLKLLLQNAAGTGLLAVPVTVRGIPLAAMPPTACPSIPFTAVNPPSACPATPDVVLSLATR